MKKELTKSILLGSLVLTSIAFGSFKANAADFNQDIAHNSNLISPGKFPHIPESFLQK